MEWSPCLQESDPAEDIYVMTGALLCESSVEIQKTQQSPLYIVNDFINANKPYNDETWWGIKKNKELTTVIEK